MYIIYRTTNNVNDKIYIGVHFRVENDDKYLGSGTLLNKAIKKYGRKNFSRKTLFEFETEEEAYLKEKEIVNSEFVKRPDTYNLCEGGKYNGVPSKETRAKMSEYARNRPKSHNLSISETKKLSGSARGKNNGMYGKSHSEEAKAAMSRARKGRKLTKKWKENISRASTGRYHSEETKRLMKENATKPWLGKNLSVSHKAAISKAQTGKTLIRKERTCPHCGKVGKGGNMARYHFKNCHLLRE